MEAEIMVNEAVDTVTIQGVLNYRNTKECDGKEGKKYTSFSGLFYFKKDMVDKINDFLDPDSKSNKKREYQLIPIERQRCPNLDVSYTHQINIGSNLAWISFLNNLQQPVSWEDFNNGDEVLLVASEKLSKSDPKKKKYLGLYLKAIALLNPQEHDVSGPNQAELKLKKILSEMEVTTQEELPL